MAWNIDDSTEDIYHPSLEHPLFQKGKKNKPEKIYRENILSREEAACVSVSTCLMCHVIVQEGKRPIKAQDRLSVRLPGASRAILVFMIDQGASWLYVCVCVCVRVMGAVGWPYSVIHRTISHHQTSA